MKGNNNQIQILLFPICFALLIDLINLLWVSCHLHIFVHLRRFLSGLNNPLQISNRLFNTINRTDGIRFLLNVKMF